MDENNGKFLVRKLFPLTCILLSCVFADLPVCAGTQLANCDCFATFTTRRINLDSNGVHLSIVEFNVALFFCLCLQDIYAHNVVSENDCDVCLGLYLFLQISPATLIYNTNVSNSTAVLLYVQHPYMTCSFQVIHVSILKMTYQKETAMHVWNRTYRSQPTCNSNLVKEHLSQQSSCLVCTMFIYALQFSFHAVSIHKMTCWKKILMHVWSRNSSIVAHQPL